jgi:hypothetical protein
MMEHLHFNDNYDCIARSREKRIMFQCQWALAHLRTLIFSNTPHSGLLLLIFFYSMCRVKNMDVQQRWAFGCGVLIAGYKYGPSRDPHTYTPQSRRVNPKLLSQLRHVQGKQSFIFSFLLACTI